MKITSRDDVAAKGLFCLIFQSLTFVLTDILIRGWQTNSQVIVSGVPSRRDKKYKGHLIAGYVHVRLKATCILKTPS